MKIQTKIALLFASLTGCIMLVMSGSLYYLTNQNIFDDYYKRLEIRAILTAKAMLEHDASNGQAYSDIRELHLETLPGEKEVIIPLPDGSISAAKRKLPGIPDPLFFQAMAEGHSTWRDEHTFYYILSYKSEGKPYLIIVSALNELSTEYLSFLRQALIISFLAASLLAFTIGHFFSKGILSPIRAITAKVQLMGASDLHLRLDRKPGTDEIAELSATFNNMLDRLETAFETQNNFVSHASHEFNTPLTSIIGEAEYALARPRSAEQYVASITNIHTAAEKLSGITRSLLQLAQTGLTGKVEEMTLVRIDELLQKVRHMTEDIMPGSQVQINLSLAPSDIQKLVVYGNQTLLELAVTNIVLNACKYSSNKPVQLALAATRDKVIIVVRDEGIGIPSDELKYIFDPFFRASNTDLYKGYGIGLPLTRNIIRIHKGELIVNSEQHQGTEIQMILPTVNNSGGDKWD